MLTVQACQQHRLAMMHLNKAKSFAAATVPVIAKLGHRRRGKRGTRSEERRNARRAHASKRKCRRWRIRGVVGVPYPTRRKNEGKNLGKKQLELSEKRRVFARKKRRGKRAERKSARKKHKAARARSRLEELTFGTFTVRTAVFNGVNGVGHIDTLLRICAAKGCDVIGLQDTKRDGTSEILASRYRVFFSGDCSMVKCKGRKGQHGVGLAIKDEIVKKPGEGGITIECISARLLKARISTKSNFVTFVVAYAPPGEAPEGQKARYMATLNCHVASVPAQEYVFVLTDANARTGKRDEGGVEADIKVLGAYGRNKFNENSKLLMGFAEDNKLALLGTLLCTPKSGVSYTFRSANRSKGQARLGYIPTKHADRRLSRCVDIRRPPFEVLESDHNLVYAKVRIPRRSARNRRKRDRTKELRSWPTLGG